MNLIVELKNFKEARAFIKKTFYNGKSSLFRLHDEEGKSVLLPIKETIDHKDMIEYVLKVDGIKIGLEYQVSDEHNLTAPLSYSKIVRTKEFNDEFYYDKDDLGPTYQKKKTTFKLWAPTAREVFVKIEEDFYPMERKDKGVFEVTVKKNLDKKAYNYIVKVNGAYHEATDPYAYASTPNAKKSVVVDLEKCRVESKKGNLKPLKRYTDAVIYELHVRDFSVKSNLKNKGKFLAFTEENALNPIKELGITHIQIMPMYDFGSVDEYNQFDYYNWGYDPVQYNVPEGSYASNVLDPYSRIIDCKKMIEAIHQEGMRVNMDVVYNHMFDLGTSAFQNIVPDYYFRMNEKGELSNGSFCGNDLDSTQKMVRKFMVDSCKRWFKFYNIDGMRFDLMGIIDYDTMNEIYDECHKIEPNLMIYGEGWNMPTMLKDELKAAQINNEKMPHIGHFNDRFRDFVKGASSQDDIKKKGYTTGDTKDVNIVMDVIMGSCFKIPYGFFFLNPSQSINYVECHDNATAYDKVCMSNPHDSEEIKKKRLKLMMGLVILSEGVPFLHAGEEFLRTKGGDHNSYISSDDVNKYDYELRKKNIDVVNYVRDLISLRMEYCEFRYDLKEDVEKNVTVSLLDKDCIAYLLKGCNRELLVLINPNSEDESYFMDEDYELIFDENGKVNGSTPTKEIIVKKHSLIVLKKTI